MAELKVVKVPKLVRDEMPAIWARFEDDVEYHIVQGEERSKALLEKIVEEAEEIREDPNIEEFADLYEVFIAALHDQGFTTNQLHDARVRKFQDRGGFGKGIYLTKFSWGPKR